MPHTEFSVPRLEREAEPRHFPGLVAHWPALQLWRGDCGLQRLIELAGDARVEALASPGDAERCYGDMQHLVLLGCMLREFLDGSLGQQLARHQPAGAAPLRLYLAQSPLLSAGPACGDKGQGSSSGRAGSSQAAGTGGTSLGDAARGAAASPAALPHFAGMQPAPLHPLMRDLGLPALLEGVQLSQVNFWASMSPTRSSLHYDPYTNLLCVARGSKTVWAALPSCTPALRPQPLVHESANHSPADLARPDLGRFPGLVEALPLVRRFEVAAGDALFIPEGWWHQVDSTEGTLAVNFWWESAVSRQLGRHMDRYYLRRLLQSLVEQQKQAALAALPRCDVAQLAAALREAAAQAAASSEGAAAERGQQRQQEEEVEEVEMEEEGEGEGAGGQAAVLEERQPARQSPEQQQSGQQAERDEHREAAVCVLASALEQHLAAGAGAPPPPAIDAVVATLAASSAQALLDALLALRWRQPGLAAHLLLRGLGPAGWELLSGSIERRQEELAEAGTPEAAEAAVGALCDELYGAVADRSQLLDRILAAKQAFAQQALRAVLETELAGCL